MPLADLDRLVREAAGRPVVLDSFPAVYEDPENADGVSLEPLGPVITDPDDDLVLYLLDIRYPGVVFEPADEFPAFREADPVPDFVVPA